MIMISNRKIFYQHIGLPSDIPLGIEIERAEGIYLYAPDGQKYIDLVSGVAVSNAGHSHPKVVEAVKNQAEKYMHLMVYGEVIQTPQVQYAYALTKELPKSLDCVYFVNSGAEATDGAVKLAKRYTGRPNVIAYKNAYHGSSMGALSFLGNEELKRNFRPLMPGVSFINLNNTSDLKEITKNTACVILEPVQGEAGVMVAEKEYLHALKKQCDKTGTLLIFDEIQTGFGRTGSMFRFQSQEIIPDILCLAKGLGGGMPLGAFIASKKIMNELTYNPMLGHITTFGGHPVSCAAGLAAMNVIKDNHLAETAEAKAALFRKRLEKHPLVKEIRNAGLMMAVDIADTEKYHKLFDKLTALGIITDPFLFREQAFRISPPLIITEDEINQSCDIIIDALNKI